MADIYTTRPGDMLDAICLRAYGPRPGALEQVLAANAGRGEAHAEALTEPLLAPGLPITLPQLAPLETTAARLRLWN